MSPRDGAPTARVKILPEQGFVELRPMLAEKLERLAASIGPAQFGSLLTPLMRQVLAHGFQDAMADEGTVWLLDESNEHLVPAYNTGPQAAEWVGRFKQPLNQGLICMVLATEQPFLENEVWKNGRQSKLLDTQLQVQTWSMIAVPFYFLRACRGVVSCVQLKRDGASQPEPPGFSPGHLERVQLAAALLSRLTEFEFLSGAVGWTSD